MKTQNIINDLNEMKSVRFGQPKNVVSADKSTTFADLKNKAVKVKVNGKPNWFVRVDWKYPKGYKLIVGNPKNGMGRVVDWHVKDDTPFIATVERWANGDWIRVNSLNEAAMPPSDVYDELVGYIEDIAYDFIDMEDDTSRALFDIGFHGVDNRGGPPKLSKKAVKYLEKLAYKRTDRNFVAKKIAKALGG